MKKHAIRISAVYTGKFTSREFHVKLTSNEFILETHVEMFIRVSRQLRFTRFLSEFFNTNFT